MPTQTPPQDKLFDLLIGTRPNENSHYETGRKYLNRTGISGPAGGEIQPFTPAQEFALKALAPAAEVDRIIRSVGKDVKNLKAEDVVDKIFSMGEAVKKLGGMFIQLGVETGKTTGAALEDARDFYQGKGTTRLKGEYMPEKALDKALQQK